MFTKRLFLIVCMFAFSFFITGDPVNAASVMDNLIQEEDKKQEGNVQLEYNEYPLSHYGMDTHYEEDNSFSIIPDVKEDINDQLNGGLGLLNSTLWQINKIFAHFIGVLVSSAFELEIISTFAISVGDAIQDIAGKDDGLWAYFLPLIICCMGIWAAYMGVVKRATSHALGGILKSIMVMVIAFAFFANADKILIKTNEFINDVQNDILSFTLSATLEGEFNENEGIATIRNQIFNLMVKYPYLLLQYGTIDENVIEGDWNKGGSRIDTILNTSALSDERKDAVRYEVKDLNNENMKVEGLTDRFVILLLSLIMNAIMGVILLLLSGSLIMYQILVLVYALFLPFSLLIGVFPTFSATAEKSIIKIFHAFYMKIALTMLVSIYFAISSMVFTNADTTQGYIMLFMIQIIITVAVWVKRNEILSIIATPFRNVNANNTLGQNIKEYKQTYFQGKKYFNHLKKPLTTPAKPLEQRASYQLKYKPGVGVVDPMKNTVSRNKPNEAEQVKPAARKASEPMKPRIQDTKNANNIVVSKSRAEIEKAIKEKESK